MSIADFARRIISNATVVGVNRKLSEMRELQKAQLVMQRDQAEAIEQLAAAIRGSMATDKHATGFDASTRASGAEPTLKS